MAETASVLFVVDVTLRILMSFVFVSLLGYQLKEAARKGKELPVNERRAYYDRIKFAQYARYSGTVMSACGFLQGIDAYGVYNVYPQIIISIFYSITIMCAWNGCIFATLHYIKVLITIQNLGASEKESGLSVIANRYLRPLYFFGASLTNIAAVTRVVVMAIAIDAADKSLLQAASQPYFVCASLLVFIIEMSVTFTCYKLYKHVAVMKVNALKRKGAEAYVEKLTKAGKKLLWIVFLTLSISSLALHLHIPSVGLYTHRNEVFPDCSQIGFVLPEEQAAFLIDCTRHSFIGEHPGYLTWHFTTYWVVSSSPFIAVPFILILTWIKASTDNTTSSKHNSSHSNRLSGGNKYKKRGEASSSRIGKGGGSRYEDSKNSNKSHNGSKSESRGGRHRGGQNKRHSSSAKHHRKKKHHKRATSSTSSSKKGSINRHRRTISRNKDLLVGVDSGNEAAPLSDESVSTPGLRIRHARKASGHVEDLLFNMNVVEARVGSTIAENESFSLIDGSRATNKSGSTHTNNSSLHSNNNSHHAPNTQRSSINSNTSRHASLSTGVEPYSVLSQVGESPREVSASLVEAINDAEDDTTSILSVQAVQVHASLTSSTITSALPSSTEASTAEASLSRLSQSARASTGDNQSDVSLPNQVTSATV